MMLKTLALSAALAVTFALAPFGASRALAQTEQQAAVDDARNTVEHFRSQHNDVAKQARDLLRHARAVLIVPQLVQGGFIFGAQGGTGVLVARGPKGEWSDPAFYGLGAASFGLQIGVEVSRVMLIIMTDRALHAVLDNKVSLGAEAGLAVATLGANGQASTTTAAGADIVAIAESKGLFGGLAFDGGVMAPRPEWNAAYYGGNVSAHDILIRRTVHNPGAATLKRALAGL
jgi:lipid-binding SYLF domain-containing protein